MLNGIIDGICESLHTAFGDGYTIYTESVKQGFNTPCFFVQLISPANAQLLGIRWIRQSSFCVQYFPESDNEPKTESNMVLGLLFCALEYIKVGDDMVRGTRMRGEFIDGVLSFFVNYNMIVRKTEEQAPMETLQIKENKTKG